MHAEPIQAFPARETPTLATLSSTARTWGTFSLVLGTLGLLGVVPFMALYGDRTHAQIMTIIAVAAFAAVGVLAGTSYVTAGRELAAVRLSATGGPELAVRGLGALGRAFRLEAIVTGMSISLAFAGGLVLGALRNV